MTIEGCNRIYTVRKTFVGKMFTKAALAKLFAYGALCRRRHRIKNGLSILA